MRYIGHDALDAPLLTGTMEQFIREHVHHTPAEEVLKLLDVDPQKGLDMLEVRARQERFGLNEIPTTAGHGR
jgi:hypothetical protein